MARILHPGSTPGPTWGGFTILAAGFVGPTGAVHAIEAFPDNARALARNVARNAAKNVCLHHLALSDHPGSVVVGRQAGSNSGSITAGPRGSDARVRVRVRVRASTLDALDTGDGPVALLKIDVEGLEARVFAAAPRTLGRVGAVMVEISEGALPATDRRSRSCSTRSVTRASARSLSCGDRWTPCARGSFRATGICW